MRTDKKVSYASISKQRVDDLVKKISMKCSLDIYSDYVELSAICSSMDKSFEVTMHPYTDISCVAELQRKHIYECMGWEVGYNE